MTVGIWANDKALERLEVIGATLAAVVLYGAYVNFVQLGQDQLASVSLIFSLMLIFSGVFFVGRRHFALQTVGFGSKNAALMALIAGAVAGIVLTGQKVVISTPLFQAAAGAGINAIFVGVVAPLAEETFFRGSLQPTITEWTNNALVGVVGQAALFSAFHFAVSGGSLAFLQSALMFGLLVGAGNLVLKSTAFGYSAHLVNNLRVVGWF